MPDELQVRTRTDPISGRSSTFGLAETMLRPARSFVLRLEESLAHWTDSVLVHHSPLRPISTKYMPPSSLL